jgi:hypothetical protein
VDDVFGWYDCLREGAVNLLGGVREIEEIQVRAFFLEDPGGYALEIQGFVDRDVARLFQWPSARGPGSRTARWLSLKAQQAQSWSLGPSSRARDSGFGLPLPNTPTSCRSLCPKTPRVAGRGPQEGCAIAGHSLFRMQPKFDTALMLNT